MDLIFLKILNMSIAASWLVVAIVLLRLLLKRAPKALVCFLWAFVAVRLVFPISFESELSLIPSAETVPTEIVNTESPRIDTGITAINKVVNPIFYESLNTDSNGDKKEKSNYSASENDFVASTAVKSTKTAEEANIIYQVISIASKVWIAGIIVMALYALVSYGKIFLKVREAVAYKGNIWFCDRIESPFVLGLLRPRILLPSDIKDNEIEYVLAHERAHLKRGDHLWKPIGFLLLAIYWFNPVMWLAYILLCKDIELACDEKVIKKMNANDKRAYTTTLLDYSISRKMISACPLAFGESGVESRIKSVLSYRKPTFWIIVAALIALVGVGIGFLTNPKSEKNTNIDTELDTYISQVILEENENMHSEGYYANYYCSESHKILDIKKDGNNITVYAWVLVREFDLVEGEMKEVGGSHIPTAITVKAEEDGQFSLVEYWVPRDGSYYASDIKNKFPKYVYEEAIDSQLYIKEQMAECNAMAEEYYAKYQGNGNTTEIDIESAKKVLLEKGYYKYPDTEGMHGNTIVDKCRIPTEVLDIMTTEQLAKAVIDYPMLMIHFASSQSFGTDLLQSACDAYKELLTRDDAKDVLITQVKLHEVNVDSYLEIECLKDIILAETSFVNVLTDEDKEYLNSYEPDAKLLGYYVYPAVDFVVLNIGIDMCKISKEIVENMTTEQLAQAVFDYPYICYLAEAIKYPNSMYYSKDVSDAYNEILTREDAEYELFRKVTKYDGIMALEYKVQAMKEILLFEGKLNGNWTEEENEYLKNMQSHEKNRQLYD